MRALAVALLLLALGGAAAADVAPTARPGTQLLLLRLALRMNAIDEGYTRMSPLQRAQALDAAESVLREVRLRRLAPHQQSSVFSYEMRLRALRGEMTRR